MNSKTKMILSILVSLAVIGIIVIIIYLIRGEKDGRKDGEDVRKADFKTQVKGINEMFNNLNSDVSKPNELGGFICNNYGMRWFKMMLDEGDATMKNTAVCSHIFRKTCSAYSYIRRDLMPMIFKMIGIQDSVPCGIILDVRKCWPLITLMTIVDGDTNNRTCCSNESGGGFIWKKNDNIPNCIKTAWEKALTDNNVIGQTNTSPVADVFIWPATGLAGMGSTRGNCTIDGCKDNLKCKYCATGGNWNWWDMAGRICTNQGIGDCVSFKAITNIEDAPQQSWVDRTAPDPTVDKPWIIVGVGQGVNKDKTEFDSSNGCNFCSATNLCTMKYLPDKYKADNDDSSYINMKGTNYQQHMNDQQKTPQYGTIYDKSDNELYNFIGPDGKGWEALYGISGGYNGSGGTWLGKASVEQCRWEKKYWSEWINSLRTYYKSLSTLINPDSTVKNERDDFASGKNFMENEVNLFIDSSNNYNNPYYKKANEIWQSAIVGFYYEADTCEDIYAPFKNLGGKGITDHCNQLYAARTFWVDNMYCKDSSGKMYNPRSDGEFIDPAEDAKHWAEDQGKCDTLCYKPPNQQNENDCGDRLTVNEQTAIRKKWENKVRVEAKDLVHKVANMFNNNHNLNVPVFISTASSQLFPRYNDLKQTLERNVTFDQMFYLDPTFQSRVNKSSRD